MDRAGGYANSLKAEAQHRVNDSVVTGLSVIGANDSSLSSLPHDIIHEAVVNGSLRRAEVLSAAILFWCKSVVFFTIGHRSLAQ